MNTKEDILLLLENNKGTYLSGEDIADTLSVSRTAVWKAVNALKKDGYSITAVTNKGYMLSEETDILSEQGIRRFLDPECTLDDIVVMPIVSSTNIVAKEKAAGGAREGLTVIAGQQTAGKGRIGRSFFSPPDTGIYMSILLRPEKQHSGQAVKITTIAAVAACEAIEAVACDTKAGIKWVNDIYIDGKKVSGILTEASFGLEDGMIDYAVLGIGFNVYYPENMPKEIENVLGAIFAERRSDVKNRLAAEFLNHFDKYYRMGDTAEYSKKYRERSLVIGKEINVHYHGDEGKVKKAVAIDVDDDCHLIVKYPDGTYETLSSGEISVRLT